jgi:hypothetical protein
VGTSSVVKHVAVASKSSASDSGVVYTQYEVAFVSSPIATALVDLPRLVNCPSGSHTSLAVRVGAFSDVVAVDQGRTLVPVAAQLEYCEVSLVEYGKGTERCEAKRNETTDIVSSCAKSRESLSGFRDNNTQVELKSQRRTSDRPRRVHLNHGPARRRGAAAHIERQCRGIGCHVTNCRRHRRGLHRVHNLRARTRRDDRKRGA